MSIVNYDPTLQLQQGFNNNSNWNVPVPVPVPVVPSVSPPRSHTGSILSDFGQYYQPPYWTGVPSTLDTAQYRINEAFKQCHGSDTQTLRVILGESIVEIKKLHPDDNILFDTGSILSDFIDGRYIVSADVVTFTDTPEEYLNRYTQMVTDSLDHRLFQSDEKIKKFVEVKYTFKKGGTK
jgi:hypothetical protein